MKEEFIIALNNLVELKEYKDKYGEDEFYSINMPRFWKYAMEVLEKYKTKLKDINTCSKCGDELNMFQSFDGKNNNIHVCKNFIRDTVISALLKQKETMKLKNVDQNQLNRPYDI